MGRIEDLQKLKELKDAGALTEAEYEVEKYKVLIPIIIAIKIQ